MVKFLFDMKVDVMFVLNLFLFILEQVDDIVYDGSVDMMFILDELYKIVYNGFYIKLLKFEFRMERQCDFDENNVVVVRWDGEVVFCYCFFYIYKEYIFGREKKVNVYFFGNVKEQSLVDIWMSEKYIWFCFMMKNYMYFFCIDCDLREVCDFVKMIDIDCWGNELSCVDCFWLRRIVQCLILQYMFGKFF